VLRKPESALVDDPNKFGWPAPSKEDQLGAALERARRLREVMERWNAEARALGYGGVAELLAALRPATTSTQQ